MLQSHKKLELIIPLDLIGDSKPLEKENNTANP
jgi:hypothetical protein